MSATDAEPFDPDYWFGRDARGRFWSLTYTRAGEHYGVARVLAAADLIEFTLGQDPADPDNTVGVRFVNDFLAAPGTAVDFTGPEASRVRLLAYIDAETADAMRTWAEAVRSHGAVPAAPEPQEDPEPEVLHTFQPTVTATVQPDGRWRIEFDWSDSYLGGIVPGSPDVSEQLEHDNLIRGSVEACAAVDAWAKTQPSNLLIAAAPEPPELPGETFGDKAFCARCHDRITWVATDSDGGAGEWEDDRGASACIPGPHDEDRWHTPRPA